MKKFLIPLLAAIALPTSVEAGIPQRVNPDKWIRISEAFMVDTEDVEVKKGKLRFYIQRNAIASDAGQKDTVAAYQGKLRINCDKFTALVQGKVNNGFGGSYVGNDWRALTNDHMGYDFANYFCYLTGSDGYTKESDEPEWVKKIINNIAIQKIERKEKSGNINCNSPVWKNKPRCN